MINSVKKAWLWCIEWRARRCARHWVLRFELSDVRPLSDAERTDFDEWCAADVRHESLFRASWTAHIFMMAAVWELRGENRERQALPASRMWVRVTAYGFAAAVLLVSAVLAVRLMGSNVRTYETRSGESRHVRLPDGSELQLSTRTRVLWDRCSNIRCVTLTGGEAYFSVRRDKNQPFVVQVSGAAIRVIGTEFDVRQSQSEVTITVAEGKVAVFGRGSNGPWSRELNINEQLTFNSSGIAVDAHQAVASTASSWRHGALQVDDSVPVAVCRLSEYIDAPVKYDPGVADYTIHGLLDLTHVPQTLMKLPTPAPIIVERIGDSYVVHLRTQAGTTHGGLIRCPY